MRDAKNARFLALASLLLGFGVGCGRAQNALALAKETPPEQALTRTSVTIEPPIPGEGPLLEVWVKDPLGVLECEHAFEIVAGRFAYEVSYLREGNCLYARLSGEYTEPSGVNLHMRSGLDLREPVTAREDGSFTAMLDLSHAGAVLEITLHGPDALFERITPMVHVRTEETTVFNSPPHYRELTRARVLRLCVPAPSTVELALTLGNPRSSPLERSSTLQRKFIVAEPGVFHQEVALPTGSLRVQLPPSAGKGELSSFELELVPELDIFYFLKDMGVLSTVPERRHFELLPPGHYLLIPRWQRSESAYPYPDLEVTIGTEEVRVTPGQPAPQGRLTVFFNAGAPTTLKVRRANYFISRELSGRTDERGTSYCFDALDRAEWFVRAEREEGRAYGIVDTRNDADAVLTLDNWTSPALIELQFEQPLPKGRIECQIQDAAGQRNWILLNSYQPQPQELAAVPGPLLIRARHESGLIAEAEILISERVGGRQSYPVALKFHEP